MQENSFLCSVHNNILYDRDKFSILTIKYFVMLLLKVFLSKNYFQHIFASNFLSIPNMIYFHRIFMFGIIYNIYKR